MGPEAEATAAAAAAEAVAAVERESSRMDSRLEMISGYTEGCCSVLNGEMGVIQNDDVIGNSRYRRGHGSMIVSRTTDEDEGSQK